MAKPPSDMKLPELLAKSCPQHRAQAKIMLGYERCALLGVNVESIPRSVKGWEMKQANVDALSAFVVTGERKVTYEKVTTESGSTTPGQSSKRKASKATVPTTTKEVANVPTNRPHMQASGKQLIVLLNEDDASAAAEVRKHRKLKGDLLVAYNAYMARTHKAKAPKVSTPNVPANLEALFQQFLASQGLAPTVVAPPKASKYSRLGTGVGGAEHTALRKKANLVNKGAYLARENGYTDRKGDEYVNVTYRDACIMVGTLPAKEMAKA